VARPTPPLVRLKVEYSGGYATLPAGSFGQALVGRVANPDSILLFFKRKSTAGAGTRQSGLFVLILLIVCDYLFLSVLGANKKSTMGGELSVLDVLRADARSSAPDIGQVQRFI
jgi:hypothetical protein